MSKYINKRFTKSYLVKGLYTLMVLFLLSPVLIISATTLNGQGITFNSITATMETAKVMNNIKNRNFTKTTQYVGFWNNCLDPKQCNHTCLKETKDCFVNDLEVFFHEDREFVEFSDISFRTDDHFTSGSVELVISERRDYYTIGLNIVKQNGKLYPMSIKYISANHQDEDKIEEFSNEFMKVMNTYNPG